MPLPQSKVPANGSNQPVRIFAHELRKQIWSKLFGINSGLRSASCVR
ncbi:hypothetical protein LT85_1396 [Collimonas arenae]|uniref:Uncharacterized protein n=1 Tax=Collimonas arenae TaxID=279058 RepID=A0A0A1FA51_9BURK|nr:hypothetical protein LT85_1396 [Collimonas arenae]